MFFSVLVSVEANGTHQWPDEQSQNFVQNCKLICGLLKANSQVVIQLNQNDNTMGESRLVKFISNIKLLVSYRKLFTHCLTKKSVMAIAEEMQASFPYNPFRRFGKDINVGTRNNIPIIILFEIIKLERIRKFCYFSYSLCYPWIF